MTQRRSTDPENLSALESGPASDAVGTSGVTLVTGLSGAGKSTALNALEDMGYEVVDNLPVSLIASLAREPLPGGRPLAIGVDVRTRDFGEDRFQVAVEKLLAQPGLDMRILFLDCDDAVIVRRFSQTRRRHPLARDLPVADGIRIERQRLAPLRDLANTVVDTTDLTEGALRTLLETGFSPVAAPGLSIQIESFAFGRGLPREADLVFDVRFLRNPHYVEALRPLTGKDPDVGAYVAEDPDFPSFFDRLVGFIEPLLPRYRTEGKSYLTIAIGCTGGRHRSVYTVESLAHWLQEQGHDPHIRHRELDHSLEQPK
jgi:UPF0042 nucleotide-binding protein